jgi:hypothetical protein
VEGLVYVAYKVDSEFESAKLLIAGGTTQLVPQA